MGSALKGVIFSVTGNFDREKFGGAVRRNGGRVDALVHKNVHFVIADKSAIEQVQKFNVSLSKADSVQPLTLLLGTEHATHTQGCQIRHSNRDRGTDPGKPSGWTPR